MIIAERLSVMHSVFCFVFICDLGAVRALFILFAFGVWWWCLLDSSLSIPDSFLLLCCFFSFLSFLLFLFLS